ncbi:MAG: hypothetical protein ABI411_17685 [Tahibacter sp.]
MFLPISSPLRFSSVQLLAATLVGLLLSAPAFSQQLDIDGPRGSEQFGKFIAPLPNGNVVVCDPIKPGTHGLTYVGAAYLYSSSGALISVLTGSHQGDGVCSRGITVLANGNFVIASNFWHGNWGAVTLVDGTVGLNGVVSAENSLIGGHWIDEVGGSEFGYGGVTPLPNGNFVVVTPDWTFMDEPGAGAVTWVNGSTGLVGPISAANSLIGTQGGDQVGFTGYGPDQYYDARFSGITVLANGNYVISSLRWARVGAVTWASGTAPIVGVVGATNSIIGDDYNRPFASGGITPLRNGNYVIGSPEWSDLLGAATWGNGQGGTVGVVSPSNSFVGTTSNQRVGQIVTALSNGHYVISSAWSEGPASNVGAATWANGATGLTGSVSLVNSLVGSRTDDYVGGDVLALTNGNYVLVNSSWHDATNTAVGAATWANGTTGLTGRVSPANSLIGNAQTGKLVDSAFGRNRALANGNYVVSSTNAVTWADGMTPRTGTPTAADSILIGNGVIDSVAPLTNGNYVIANHVWSDGTRSNLGSATWAKGSAPSTGTVSAANSLVGASSYDWLGYSRVLAIGNGDYIVPAPYFNIAGVAAVGLMALGNGRTGSTGVPSLSNAITGSQANDQVGSKHIVVLANGRYLFTSPLWDNGSIVDAGAVTLGGGGKSAGFISALNSVRGTVAGGGAAMSFAYDATADRLIVGQPSANRVSFLKVDQLFANGLE